MLLCYHAKNLRHDVFWRIEQKTGEVDKLLNIRSACEKLGKDVFENISYVHAILGCGTALHVCRSEKGVTLKLVQDSKCYQEQTWDFSSFGSWFR